MTKKTSILFTHNTAMWYRIPFFKKLSEIYDLDLVFTHINVIEDIYDNKVNNQIPGLEGVNYTILKNKQGFAKGLITKVKEKHDVIIGGSWDTAQEMIETLLIYTLAKIKHTPFIIWREDWDWKKEDSIKEKLLQKLVKYLSKHANAILVPGTLHKQYFENKLQVPSKNIHIMPNVSNITDESNEEIKPNKDTKTILYVGRLIPRKGVKYLIDAYIMLQDKLPKSKLIIIGTGPQEEYLKSKVKKFNMEAKVIFTGKIPNDQLKKYYKKSNLVVIPSITEKMGDPWVFILNEAMYFSNPVIASTAVGAAPDMIKGNGFIVPEQNSTEIFNAMYKILNDEKLEDKMRKRSKEIINNDYQYSNMVNSFEETINTIIKQ